MQIGILEQAAQERKIMRRVAKKVDIDEICELYKTLSLKGIAKRVGIGHGSVRRLLVEAGVTLRTPNTPGWVISRDVLVNLYINQQLSTTDIAVLLKIGQATVLDKLLDHGIPIRSIKEGERLAKLHGKKMGRTRLERVGNGHGYYLIKRPKHSRANCNGYVMEHILVWEKAYGCLPDIAHHINGDPGDNRVCNLHSFGNNSEHSKFHAYANRRSPVRFCPKHLLKGYLRDWLLLQ